MTPPTTFGDSNEDSKPPAMVGSAADDSGGNNPGGYFGSGSAGGDEKGGGFLAGCGRNFLGGDDDHVNNKDQNDIPNSKLSVSSFTSGTNADYCDLSIFTQRRRNRIRNGRLNSSQDSDGNNSKKTKKKSKRNSKKLPSVISTRDDHDSVLAREFNELSFEERNQVYEEVHGVAQPPNESPAFLEEQIEALKQAISKLSRTKRRALDRAFFLKPSLANDRKFQIMFLRSDRYDPIKAATRMAKYFTYKLELFGEDKLVKDITLEDMTEDDMECFHRGSVQPLKTRDQSGRFVWFVSNKAFVYKHWKNHIRYVWYQIMATLENEDAQIHGIVDINYCVGLSSFEKQFPELMKEGGQILNMLPYRIVGLHFCYDDVRLRPALNFVQMICARHTRLRIKFHYGSDIEAQYALLTFGIPVAALPIHKDGSLVDKISQNYITERRSIEAIRAHQQNLPKKYVDYPSSNDILLGRGRPYQEYCGNQILMNLVEDERQYYQSVTDKFEKTCVTMSIVSKIKNDIGGKFLQRTSEGWEVVTDTVAREKVSHTFRTKTSIDKRNNLKKHASTNISSVVDKDNRKDPIVPAPTLSLSSMGDRDFGDVWDDDE